jgi:hypothetical protein
MFVTLTGFWFSFIYIVYPILSFLYITFECSSCGNSSIWTVLFALFSFYSLRKLDVINPCIVLT